MTHGEPDIPNIPGWRTGMIGDLHRAIHGADSTPDTDSPPALAWAELLEQVRNITECAEDLYTEVGRWGQMPEVARASRRLGVALRGGDPDAD